MMVSMATGAVGSVLAGGVALGPVVTIARASATSARAGSIWVTSPSRTSFIASACVTGGEDAARPALMRARCVLAAARKRVASGVSKDCGMPTMIDTGTCCPSGTIRNELAPMPSSTLRSVTRLKGRMVDGSGMRCRMTSTVTRSHHGLPTNAVLVIVFSLATHVTSAERALPCVATRRLIGPRSRPTRRIAVLVARMGRTLALRLATSVRAAGALAAAARMRPNAGAPKRTAASSFSVFKWRVCRLVPTTRLSCSWRTRWLARCRSAA